MSSPELESVYFRSYGLHTVQDSLGDIHIASEPDWDSLFDLLISDLPEDGVIVTPELSGFSGPLAEIPEHKTEICGRIEGVRELSRATDAVIMFGTPLREKNGSWYNGVLHFRNGRVDGCDLKSNLSMFEEQSGMLASGDGSRLPRFGRTTLICSEMLSPEELAVETSTVLVPACWATPLPDVRGGKSPLKLDDRDYLNFLRLGASTVMSSYLAVDTIVVADRNMPGSDCDGPFNAVFSRVQ
ncbi:MAG TPA: hypothetical protein VFW77_01550 [Candidatus Saccharimonadales bacterium]|nr:hypothetical protein [Candidatus Saccharimonadales bacterium]